MKTEEIIVPVRAEGLDEAIEKAKKLAALEKEIQELQREAGAQRFRGSLNSISIILLAAAIGFGFWRIYGDLIRISETVRESLRLIGEQATDLSIVIQQVNDFLTKFIEIGG